MAKRLETRRSIWNMATRLEQGGVSRTLRSVQNKAVHLEHGDAPRTKRCV